MFSFLMTLRIKKKEMYSLKVSVEDVDNLKEEICFIFDLKERIGALANALKIFEENRVNLVHIESRMCKTEKGRFEFFVDCKAKTKEQLTTAIDQLKEISTYLHVFNKPGNESEFEESVPWFPRRIRDLDQFSNRILSYGAELDSDHPVSYFITQELKLLSNIYDL